jgi:hypothetical protein
MANICNTIVQYKNKIMGAVGVSLYLMTPVTGYIGLPSEANFKEFEKTPLSKPFYLWPNFGPRDYNGHYLQMPTQFFKVKAYNVWESQGVFYGNNFRNIQVFEHDEWRDLCNRTCKFGMWWNWHKFQFQSLLNIFA